MIFKTPKRREYATQHTLQTYLIFRSDPMSSLLQVVSAHDDKQSDLRWEETWLMTYSEQCYGRVTFFGSRALLLVGAQVYVARFETLTHWGPCCQKHGVYTQQPVREPAAFSVFSR